MEPWMIVIGIIVLMVIVGFLLPGKAIKDDRNMPPRPMSNELQSLIDSQRKENSGGFRRRR